METNQQREERLWRIAQARAHFKSHLITYLIVNGALWVLWFITTQGKDYPWPIWTTFGWGIAIAFGYFRAYHNDRFSNALQEYDKLLKEQENKHS